METLRAGELHHAAVGGEVPAQDREPALGVDRVVERADHLLTRLLGGVGGLLGDGAPGDGRRVGMEDARVEQPLGHQPNAACPEQIRGHESAARLEVGEKRRALAHAVEVVDRQLHTRLFREREEVQDRVGRAAGGCDAGDRVLQRVARDDRAGTDVLLDELHHEPPHVLGRLSLLAVLGGHHRRTHGGDPQHLERRGHRVGGVLAAAGPRARRGDGLELGEVLVAHVARRVGADGLEHVLDRHVLSAEAARCDGSAVEHDARHVEAGERHHAAGDRLVAAREGHHAVEEVGAGDQLD